MCSIIPASWKLLLLTLGQGVSEQDLNQIGHGQNGTVYSFPSLHWMKTTSVRKAMECILPAHQGFHLDVYGHPPVDRSCIVGTQGDPLWRRGNQGMQQHFSSYFCSQLQ